MAIVSTTTKNTGSHKNPRFLGLVQVFPEICDLLLHFDSTSGMNPPP